MVILTIEQCLSQLNIDVKNQIKKQLEEYGAKEEEDLAKLLTNIDFRRNLLSSLSVEESSSYLSILRKYSMYMPTMQGEEQMTPMEEKIALLLLRQKGIAYKLDEKKHKQQYIIPSEFVEAYFENMYHQEYECSNQPSISLKKYVYYLVELLKTLKETQIKKVVNSDLMTSVNPSVNWSLLHEFLVSEKLLLESQAGTLVNEQQCEIFFRKSTIEIKKMLTKFILWHGLEESLSCHFLYWIIFSLKGGLERKRVENFITEQGIHPKVLQEVLEQLVILDIVSPYEEIILSTNELYEEVEEAEGMETGVLEFLVPVSISNTAIWIFRSWGTILQWDAMIHFSFTSETVARALEDKHTIDLLKEYLLSYFPENVVTNWHPTLNNWVEKGMPIVKKELLVFYRITEKLHRNYIVEHWKEWYEQTENGFLIEREFVNSFEKLLSKLSLRVLTENRPHDFTNIEDELEITLKDEFPLIGTALPEVERLPKQWFIPTYYEERMVQRILKQAIVLKLSVQIETVEQEIIKLYPLKLILTNGSYSVITKEETIIKIHAISRISIIHPLN
ncbi:hypothetical protein DS745_17435 [Anaerobacillus alkaliphilus]|uniref:Helicase XPB/Ssl2 N-terminal domain-containing protein n=1 Tax=Anaerobacillus alkaliphilus TaxID=1548597 RepID=A0A4Q0VPP5_9BACI|nr:hypothetical protein [Anaerobacillus alkaliphilus]RXI98129.1 hypothetical protein DS745_17435 [Anaerobacillus alkaliphilus]